MKPRALLRGSVAPILVTVLLLAGTATAAGVTEIYPDVIGGGGGHSEAGPYVIDATVGQAVVGVVDSPPYELCAGFWCGQRRYKTYLPLVLRGP